jgi:4-hydroxymandelate oxidase
MELLTVADYEALAATRLPDGALGYYRSGADAEWTLSENQAAWHRIAILPRVLVDVSKRNLRTEILGRSLELPILIAPTACQAMAHREGELATARAAGTAGTIMVLSSLSNHRVEDVVSAGSGPVWFQLYVSRVRDDAYALIERVEAAGCEALVVTVDVPVAGQREADSRSRFSIPEHLDLPNLVDPGRLMGATPPPGRSALAELVEGMLDASLGWKDLETLVRRTRLPVFVKGVLRADDAIRALEHGAAGVIVSNHGGRQLDTVPATATVLPRIADALGGRGTLLVDGGIRRGTDVLKALALGADGVLVGRPILWGLAVEGERGATDVLGVLRSELDRAMALSGCPDLAACTRDLLDLP